MEKLYLGDAVYVDLTKHGEVILTTEDGIRTTNTIILEPKVLQSFLDYLQTEDSEKGMDVKTSCEFGRDVIGHYIENVARGVTKEDYPDL